MLRHSNQHICHVVIFFLVDFDIRGYIVSPSDPALYFGKLSVTAFPVYTFDKGPIKRKE